jgi:hypothetical protein
MGSEAPAKLTFSARNRFQILKHDLFIRKNLPSLRCTSTRRASEHYLGIFKSWEQKFLSSLPKCSVFHYLHAIFAVFSLSFVQRVYIFIYYKFYSLCSNYI